MAETKDDKQAGIDKQLAESRAKTEKRTAATLHAAGEVQPTPTQEECDRAALGDVVLEKESDGSPEQPPQPVEPQPVGADATRRRQASAQSPGAGYDTRATRPAEKKD